MRVDGKFVDLEKNVPPGQYVSTLKIPLGILGLWDILNGLMFP